MSRNWHTNSVLKKDTKTSSDVYTQLQVTSDRPVGRPKPAAWCDAMHSYCFSMREANFLMLETVLNPINWSDTYGPYELHRWEEYLSICQQLSDWASVTDLDDYMSYQSLNC